MKIKLECEQKLWFTSDTHYNHANICSATTKWTDPVTCREFTSLEQMNSHLIANINETVEQDDILIHLGDWSFGGFESIKKFRDSIFCKNVHLITGNHDHHIENNRENCQELFSSVNKYLELTVKWNVGTPFAGEQDFVLMHFPIASWNNLARNSIHLHGHVHLSKQYRIGPGKMMDVGVDGNDLRPISMGEVLKVMSKQPIKSMLEKDHHTIVENYKK
jgi:calcineurin-like phosphoesterase family protein